MPKPSRLTPARPFALFAVCLALSVAAASAARAFDVQGGIGFVAVSGAPAGTELVLDDASHQEAARGTADDVGSLIFRDLEQGARFFVRQAADAPGSGTAVTVLVFRDHPDASFYQAQTLHEGYNYITMRDGTLLAAMVRPPLGSSLAQGPFPTVVEYSGYSPADPDNPQPSTLLASALGYATVGVNMRGSGCSGGVLDLFDLPTTADGYDVIETVAAQSWVQGGKPGMVGISFPGISQLFVGGARPPHLAAIAPLSVIADIYRAPGFPGGIFNNGFGQTWLQERLDDAQPAPAGGQGWARKRVNDGDTTCLANQGLRRQTQNPIEFTTSHPFYEPALMDQRSPINWVADVQVPVFLAGAWQDEQTGSGFASLLKHFPKRRDIKFTALNGVHSSPLEPAVLYNWIAFLDLYVAHRLPDPGRAAPFAAVIYGQILEAGAPVPPLPADRFDGITDFDQAKRLFESDPRVRVLMENGAGSPTPGLPAARFELGFAKWPPPGVGGTAFYFGPDGTLIRRRPRRSEEGVDAYRPDPLARPAQTIPGQGQSESWVTMPDYDWRPLVDNTAVAYATAPLTNDVTMVGPGSVDLWLRSSAADTDLQVTLSEIRPDGKEAYVQSGWLRASHRKLDRKKRTRLDPVVTHLERDAAALPAGVFSSVRVALMASAHVFRSGSRIRISVEAPGDDRTRWAFSTPETDGLVLNEIARTHVQASRVVLPVIRAVDVPEDLPPCPGLRGQPCRTYVPATNGG